MLEGLEKVMYWVLESNQDARKNAQDYFGEEPDKCYEREVEKKKNSDGGSFCGGSCGSFSDPSDAGGCGGSSCGGGCSGCGGA